mgnify:CR=1 FL=1
MREIVFDTETTGLNPASGDRIVEIGCIEMVNRVETGRHFHAYFNPERPMPFGAEAVHGLSDVFLSDKPRFVEVVEALLEFIEDAPLVAHNAGFDFSFLNHELSLCGRPLICTSRMVDTLAMARTRHPGAKHSLDALCMRFGVDRSQRIKHGALLDAHVAEGQIRIAEVFKRDRQVGHDETRGAEVGREQAAVGRPRQNDICSGEIDRQLRRLWWHGGQCQTEDRSIT